MEELIDANLVETDTHRNRFILIDEDLFDSMKDPFLYLECKRCGTVENLPVDQTRADFTMFEVTYDNRSPDGCFYKCKQCQGITTVVVNIVENEDK